jgi:hypothetical protein
MTTELPNQLKSRFSFVTHYALFCPYKNRIQLKIQVYLPVSAGTNLIIPNTTKKWCEQYDFTMPFQYPNLKKILVCIPPVRNRTVSAGTFYYQHRLRWDMFQEKSPICVPSPQGRIYDELFCLLISPLPSPQGHFTTFIYNAVSAGTV